MVNELNSVTKIKDAIHEVTGLTFDEYSSKAGKETDFMQECYLPTIASRTD